MTNRLFYSVFLFLCFIFSFHNPIWAQKKNQVSGVVFDAKTQKKVEGALVFDGKNFRSEVTGKDGAFTLSSFDNEFLLEVQHVKYQSYKKTFQITSDTVLSIFLEEKINAIDEFEVVAYDVEKEDRMVSGVIELSQKELNALPALLGTPDVIAAVQKGAGVQSVSEGVSGMFVRGGDVGQNLMIYDDMEIVDPTHLIGCFSSFNPYLINKVEFYKGVTPLEYSSRLSSALVVSSFDSITTQPFITANIGTLASMVGITTSIGNVDVMLGGRRTQLELYQEAAKKFSTDSASFFHKNSYSFYDTNGKIIYHTQNKRNHFSFSWYLGGDCMKYDDSAIQDMGISWENRAGSIVWDRFGSRSKNTLVFGYTAYDFEFSAYAYPTALQYSSEYETFFVKNANQTRLGAHLLSLFSEIRMNRIAPVNYSFVNEKKQQIQDNSFCSYEATFGLANRLHFNKQWFIEVGATLNWFGFTGPYTYITNPEQNTQKLYSSSSIVKQYVHVSPRASLVYKKDPDNTFTLSCHQSVQTLHRASTVSVPLPTDVWISSSSQLKPEVAHQLSLGIKSKKGSIVYSADLFAKYTQNGLIYENNWLGEKSANFEDDFLSVDGRAYGIELGVEKKEGKLKGSVFYTLSKSERRQDELNQGDWFNMKYDRPHDLSATLNYEFNDRVDAGMCFVLASGSVTTVPKGRYLSMGYLFNHYEGINDFRLPLYHRLDLGINYKFQSKLFRESILGLSVVNVYNRKNTYFFFYEMQGNLEQKQLEVQPKQVSLFPILPSISWTFKL